MTAGKASSRLASLDILRGADLFLLLFLQPVVVAFCRAIDARWLDGVLYQFDHEVWIGFRFWDLIMPLFLFMVGAAMPFSLAKYASSPSKAYRRVGRRVILLFLFGMIVQGNLLSLDPSQWRIYTNTLQAIAIGYLIAAIILLHFNKTWQIIITVLLLVIYSVPMMTCGDWTVEGNFAYAVDRAILGSFRGDLTYTWIWSSLTFGVTVMMGALAGQELRKADAPAKKIICLIVAGIICIAAGLMLSPHIPIIKRIWSTSMTLYASGICFLLMAVAYMWIDVMGHSRGLNWLKIYGMNSIAAYIMGEVIDFRSIVNSVSYGLEPLLGNFYGAWLTLGNALILWLILWLMFRNKIYLKV